MPPSTPDTLSRRILIAGAVFFYGLTAPGFGEEEAREWTSADGKTVSGRIIELEGDEITLETSRGEFKIPLSRLSEADRAFAKEWGEKAAAAAPAPASGSKPAAQDELLAGFEGLVLGEWPTSVSAEFEVEDIEVVKEDKEAEEYIYRSPHFEFRSPVRLSTSVVREFARTFEATFEFMRIMPIGLNPQPWGDGYYLTQLYEGRRAYELDGGMEGSGGMHSYSWRGREIISSIIKVPMSSLGVENTGTRFIVDHKKQSDTLIHEIAHQVTGRWLPLTPVWFKEGLAETVSTQRYDGGRFVLTSMDRAIREDVTRRSGDSREFSMLNLKTLMTMSGQQWAKDLASGEGGRLNYPSANVLFYYFLRLHGDGDGKALVEYLKAIAEKRLVEEEAMAEILLAGETFEVLQEKVIDAWRSEGLRLTFQ